jgi:hypothetical protein
LDEFFREIACIVLQVEQLVKQISRCCPILLGLKMQENMNDSEQHLSPTLAFQKIVVWVKAFRRR